MANSLLTIGMITRKAIQLFRNSNSFLQMIDRQYDSEFGKSGAKIGNQLRIRLPNEYAVRTGATAVPQSTNETNVTLTVGTMQGVDTSFTSTDLALSLDDFSTRILAPMVNVLAGAVAVNIMGGVETVPNLVRYAPAGTFSSPVQNTWLQAGGLLDIFACPRMDRNVIIDPTTMYRTVGSFSGLFNSVEKISKQYVTGLIGTNVLGFDTWAMDQTVILHTTGTFSAGGTVNGANQSGSTITINATTGTLNVGDVITFVGVNAVNPVNKTNVGFLKQFVVTAPVASGATSVNIYPALIPPVSGQQVAYQTVTASPATSAAMALANVASEVYRKNFAFHPTACTMVTADLDLPTGGVVSAGREAYDGISMRVIRAYQATTDVWLSRLDILYGWVWPRPEWAVIVEDIV